VRGDVTVGGWGPIRRHLCCHGPLPMMLFVEKEFATLTDDDYVRGRSGPVERESERDGRKHAIACIGYDDTRKMKITDPETGDAATELGAFLLLNSWGDCWGKGGSAWIAYRDAHDLLFSVETLWDENPMTEEEWCKSEMSPSWIETLPEQFAASVPTAGAAGCDGGFEASRCRCELPCDCPRDCPDGRDVVTRTLVAGKDICLASRWIPVVPAYAEAKVTWGFSESLVGKLEPIGVPYEEAPLAGGWREVRRFRAGSLPVAGLRVTIDVSRGPAAVETERRRTYVLRPQ
jgi:hypothetical protein